MFFELLKELREKAGLTQGKAAEAFNVPVRTYGSWERNERQPDFVTLVKIADFYNVTTDYLLGRTPVPVTITQAVPPPEPPQGSKRLVIKAEPDDADPADPFEQRVAAILEKELKKRGL